MTLSVTAPVTGAHALNRGGLWFAAVARTASSLLEDPQNAN